MKFTLIILFIFSSTLLSVFGQDDYYNYIKYNGDTIKLEIIKEPTVCDCYNIDWRNKEQKKICNLAYDYDFMTEEEQKEYDKQRSICEYPSICDCAHADQNDKGLLKACNQNYNYKSISEKQLQRNIEELKKCPEKPKKEISICDCINVDNYRLKEKCNELFFNDSLISETEKKKNFEAMKKCIENKSYELEVSTCDCALYGDSSDEEFKKICDEKLEEKKQNKRELTQYLHDLKTCKENQILDNYIENKHLQKSDYKYTICLCNKEEQSKEVLEKCNEIWDYKSMTEKEQKAFSNAVAKCKIK